jgi:hypothetical protein
VTLDDATVPYARAIADTGDTLMRRARTMRALGLALLGCGLAGAAAAVTAAPAAGAVALAAVPAFGAAFLCADALRVRAWQRRWLDAWAAGDVDAVPFAHAVSADARLPQHSLAAMLALLPRTDVPMPLRAEAARAFAHAGTGPVRRAAAQFAGLAALPVAAAAWGAGAGAGASASLLVLGGVVSAAAPAVAGALHRRRARELAHRLVTRHGGATAAALLAPLGESGAAGGSVR